MISHRHATILMEYLATQRTKGDGAVDAIAQLCGITRCRVYQIINRAKQQIGWHEGMSVSHAGALCRKVPSGYGIDASTPEGMYYRIQNEKANGNASWFYSGSER